MDMLTDRTAEVLELREKLMVSEAQRLLVEELLGRLNRRFKQQSRRRLSSNKASKIVAPQVLQNAKKFLVCARLGLL